MKEIIDELDFLEITNFCSGKDNIKRRRQVTDREKISAKDTSGKGLWSKIYKEHVKLNKRKTHSPIKKWATDLITEEDTQMANKHGEKVVQMETTRMCTLHYAVRVAQIQNTDDTDVGQQEWKTLCQSRL